MLIALTAIAPISIDMFLPSMPQMADDFNTSTGVLSLAVTLFLFAFAGSQLVYGPASDRFGRAKVTVDRLLPRSNQNGEPTMPIDLPDEMKSAF